MSSVPPERDETPADEGLEDEAAALDSRDHEVSDRDSDPDSYPEDLEPDSEPGGLLAALHIDDVDVKDLLKSALAEPSEREPSTAVIDGVRRTLRKESRGRYFGDGWSNTTSPIATYLVTSIVMLVVVAVAWYILSPHGVR